MTGSDHREADRLDVADADPSDDWPLSVAYLSPGWPRDAFANGIVSYVDTMAGGLRRLGHGVHVLSQNIVGGETEGVHDLSRGRQKPGWGVRLAHRLLWHVAPETVVIRPLREVIQRLAARDGLQLLEMEESFGWARRLVGRVPVPVVVRLHGPYFLTGTAAGDAEDAAFRRQVRHEGAAIRSADGVTAPSRFCLEGVRARYGLALENAEVIPNPMPVAPEGDRWRLADCDRERILFVGRMDRLKGADLVIEAYRRLRENQPGLRLELVGPDTGLVDEAGRRWAVTDYLADRVPEAWTSGAVAWLGGQPREALVALRRRAMITVVGSRFESFSLTTVEAMAHGCPIVASDVGGIPELIQEGRNGRLCRVGDAADLASKLGSLLAEPFLAARLGEQAARDCASRYNPDVLAARSVAFYRAVIAKAGSPRRGSR